MNVVNIIWGVYFALIFYYIEISVYISTLKWIENMENTNCKCSDTEYRSFIKNAVGLYLVFTTIVCIYNIYVVLQIQTPCSKLPFVLQIPFTIIWFVNVIFSIKYIDYLKKINCKCSENIDRELYYIYNWIRVGIIIIYGISLMIYMSTVGYKKYI